MWVSSEAKELGGLREHNAGKRGTVACCILDLLVAKRQTRNEAPEASGAATFGAHLRNLRERAGRTQEELAFQAGLSPHAVGSLERGVRRRPYPHRVRSLADALGLSDEERAALLAAVPKRSRAASSGRQVGTAASALSTLPNPATPLLGRERELEDITDLLIQQNVRLLTLTGIGGVGKTRLAVEVGREVAQLFPDGIAFVGLASLVRRWRQGCRCAVPDLRPRGSGEIPAESTAHSPARVLRASYPSQWGAGRRWLRGRLPHQRSGARRRGRLRPRHQYRCQPGEVAGDTTVSNEPADVVSDGRRSKTS